MAHIRVGDIRIDGSRVRIGPDRKYQSNPTIKTPSPAYEWLSRPVIRPYLALGGSALVLGGVFWLTAFWPGADPIGFLTQGGALMFLGLGMVGLAIVQPTLRRQLASQRRRVLGPAIAKIQVLLGPSAPHQTVEWLQTRSQLSESDVVLALVELRASGEVVEELDFDSGHFYYGISDTQQNPGSRDLDTRSRGLQKGISL